MACLIGLCFALEFSFKPSNLQIISDCRCWKVTIPYCQQCAKAEHVFHIRGTKRLATALLESRGVQQAESWRLMAGFEMSFSGHPTCWCYGGSCWRCLRVGCPRGSTELLPSIPCPGKRSPSQRAQVALPWERINLHVYYLTGAVGHCQAGARGWEPAEVTPGGGRQGGSRAVPAVLGTPSSRTQGKEGRCCGKTLAKQSH